jgi:hypothetical protein
MGDSSDSDDNWKEVIEDVEPGIEFAVSRMRDLQELFNEFEEMEEAFSGAAASRPLRQDQFVAIPPTIQDIACLGEDDEMSVFWHYVEADPYSYPVLAPQPLSDDVFNFVTVTNLFEEKENGDRDVRITDQLPDHILDQYEPGDDLFFIQIKSIRAGDPSAVWVYNADEISQKLSMFMFALGIVSTDDPWL